jgi:hypothetical protein
MNPAGASFACPGTAPCRRASPSHPFAVDTAAAGLRRRPAPLRGPTPVSARQGFPRSHGPPDQRFEGAWLRSRYRQRGKLRSQWSLARKWGGIPLCIEPGEVAAGRRGSPNEPSGPPKPKESSGIEHRTNPSPERRTNPGPAGLLAFSARVGANNLSCRDALMRLDPVPCYSGVCGSLMERVLRCPQGALVLGRRPTRPGAWRSATGGLPNPSVRRATRPSGTGSPACIP